MSIRILIADDHQIFRQGLKALIEKEPDMEVVAEAEDGNKALALAREVRPHVIIMDVSMPELNGIEATRQIIAEAPGAKIIALSMHTSHQFVIGMFKAGVHSYLLKECAFEELIQAIRHAVAAAPSGRRDMPHILSNGCFSQPVQFNPVDFAGLTAREVVVLQLMAEGKTSRQIADLLCISVKTVESHRKQIMDKVGTRSIAALTKYAIQQGLTSLDG